MTIEKLKQNLEILISGASLNFMADFNQALRYFNNGYFDLCIKVLDDISFKAEDSSWRDRLESLIIDIQDVKRRNEYRVNQLSAHTGIKGNHVIAFLEFIDTWKAKGYTYKQAVKQYELTMQKVAQYYNEDDHVDI